MCHAAYASVKQEGIQRVLSGWRGVWGAGSGEVTMGFEGRIMESPLGTARSHKKHLREKMEVSIFVED